jgi:hypothetical protein
MKPASMQLLRLGRKAHIRVELALDELLKRLGCDIADETAHDVSSSAAVNNSLMVANC